MKFCPPDSSPDRRSKGGFTLLEVMISAGIFLVVVGAMVALQLYQLRSYTLAGTQTMATADGRTTLNAIRDKIRSAKITYVGTFSSGTFSSISNGLPQTGNALEIFTTTNASPAQALVFYFDPATQCLNLISNGQAQVEAKYMTNYFCFQAEDYRGNILTNYQNNPVICLTMQFFQWEYPIGYISSGSGSTAVDAYDYFRLHTRITRRAKD